MASAEVVERRTKPRHLTPEGRNQLVSFLQLNPKGEVRVTVPGDDREAIPLGTELEEAIKKGGWKVSSLTVTGLPFRPVLSIVFRSQATRPPNSNFLAQALMLAGFSPELVEDARLAGMLGGSRLILVVGPRPGITPN